MRVTLNGYVAADRDMLVYDFFGIDAFSPATIRNAIEAAKDEGELILEINSGGGSVFAGGEMYTVLKSAQVHTVCEVQSLSASAASYMMLGADEVAVSPVAQIMIHNPMTVTEGNQQSHKDAVKVLDSITDSIVNAYVLKANGKTSEEEFRRMMEKTTWMDAKKAKQCGLADRILFTEDGEMPSFVNCYNGGESPAELWARYRAEQENREISDEVGADQSECDAEKAEISAEMTAETEDAQTVTDAMAAEQDENRAIMEELAAKLAVMNEIYGGK